MGLINWSIPWSGEGRTLDYGLKKDGNYILNGGAEFYIPSHDYLRYKFTPILTINFTPIKQQDEERNLNELFINEFFDDEEGDRVKSERKKKLDGSNMWEPIKDYPDILVPFIYKNFNTR